MKFLSVLTALAASPFFASAGPVSSPEGIEERQAGNCLVNRQLIDTWHESAMSRRRVAFSSENTPVENYCKYWQGDPGLHNVQCYNSEAAKSWVVDVNTPLGAWGDQVFNDRYVSSLRGWRTEYHCATG
ncbi:hypothetical protein NM208_g244 [Fusarium decemcellulare]|uniref:Uncharacterized protein n=1 Tax=Fusarium decemcellulare TaxID=57161 RepID=A0ACC1T093_9HYPO|nr:hypothetical protein NM208_g244 [Fusarium decemcellulare]